jgi:hypothetical protein
MSAKRERDQSARNLQSQYEYNIDWQKKFRDFENEFSF